MEITFHTFQEKKVSYTQLLGPRGEILIKPQLSSEMGEIQTQLSLLCKSKGGSIFEDKNHFGEFTYLNGLEMEFYQNDIDKWNGI